MSLVLTPAHLAAAFDHAAATYPNECCGLIVGRTEGEDWIAERLVPTRNMDTTGRNDRYVLHPQDRLKADEAARADGLAIVGFYHSHPDHGVYFSETDLKNSEEYQMGEPWLPPSYAYLIVSIYDKEPRDHGAFVVREGQSEPLPVRLLPWPEDAS
ncbi:M67 family metallopeptidase [bacterium]|nr:M67 family metallopeptidase [bacterium]